jgi:tetratricopeptide (TPR) repeat protein
VSETASIDSGCYSVTDGEIAVVNLQSSLRRSWNRLARDPMDPGTAERVVEEEQMALTFLGDVEALDRLEVLSTQLGQLDPTSARSALVQARVASVTHRFADALRHLATAERDGGLREAVERLSLNIDQACGTQLDEVLGARRRIAADSNSLEDLVPLGALLADLREFAEADRVYRRALQVYEDVSPFAVAWACFQLGVLWGELVPEPQTTRAADWYRRAIEYVPAYVKARVHLAEIHLRCGEPVAAEVLLTPAVESGDPEVRWRLGEAMAAQGSVSEADAQLAAARLGFKHLLDRHLLAFADHGAEFYAASGNDIHRALDLARTNVANRSTQRAVEQAQAIASLVALQSKSVSNGVHL